MRLGEAAEEHLSADSDKGGLKGPFFAPRYSQTICKSPAAEAGAKDWRTAGALAGD